MPIVNNSPLYRIEVFARNHATDFGFGSRVLEVLHLKNLGWSDYANDVPEAFFTMMQEDPQILLLRTYMGEAHLRIRREDPATGESAVVWCGLLGTEFNEKGDDVVFYGHGYVGILYWLLSDWDHTWTNASLNTIVSDLITRAKTGIANTEFQFIATGTIQAPATTSGGATPIILPSFKAYRRPILSVLRDVAALARSDTTNGVIFEVTQSVTPTFNFWGNKGVDTTQVFEYGGRTMLDFQRLHQPGSRRNEVYSAGTTPRNQLLRDSQAHSVGTIGRRQASVYFQWVRDQTELGRVTGLRLAAADRDELLLQLVMYPGVIVPPGMSFSGFNIMDRVRVKINRGITNIDALMMVMGVQVVYVNGVEHVNVLVEERSGT